MGDVMLRWTGEGLTFEGTTSHGAPILTGNDQAGPGAKHRICCPCRWRRAPSMTSW